MGKEQGNIVKIQKILCANKFENWKKQLVLQRNQDQSPEKVEIFSDKNYLRGNGKCFQSAILPTKHQKNNNC